MTEQGGGSLLECMRAFFLCCPLLEGCAVGVQELPYASPGYAVEYAQGGQQGIVRRYLDGAAVRRAEFLFAVRGVNGLDTRANLNAAALLDALIQWVEARRGQGLPALAGGRRAVKVEYTGARTAEEKSARDTRCTARFALTYYEPAARDVGYVDVEIGKGRGFG